MKEILQIITSDTTLEARWLNTLSLLEHIGARKISKTVAQTHPTLQILEHYADETRHAYAFKSLSVQLSKNSSGDYLCKDEAITYFQSLDRQVAAWLQENIDPLDQYPNYLLTTSLIERRAMQLYPLYRDVTAQDSVRAELDRIIQEETNHRSGIDRKIRDVLAAAGYKLDDIWPIEEKLFRDFLTALEFRLSDPGSRPRPYRQDPAPKISAG